MKPKYKVPKGWREVRASQKIKEGDVWISSRHKSFNPFTYGLTSSVGMLVKEVRISAMFKYYRKVTK